MRTLIALEAMKKLEDFAGVFDLKTYGRNSAAYKCEVVLNYGREAFSTDNYNFAHQRGVIFPSYISAWLYMLPQRALLFVKKAARKLVGAKLYNSVKRLLK